MNVLISYKAGRLRYVGRSDVADNSSQSFGSQQIIYLANAASVRMDVSSSSTSSAPSAASFGRHWSYPSTFHTNLSSLPPFTVLVVLSSFSRYVIVSLESCCVTEKLAANHHQPDYTHTVGAGQRKPDWDMTAPRKEQSWADKGRGSISGSPVMVPMALTFTLPSTLGEP